MAQVGLIFGGRSTEHEVSVTSARTVADGLRRSGHGVIPLGIAPDGCWVAPEQGAAALDGAVDRLDPVGTQAMSTLHRLGDSGAEVVFPIVHGTWGEDGTLQGLCEMADLPYVGTGVTSSAVAMDKVACKQVLSAQGIPVVDYEVVDRHGFGQDAAAAVERCRRFDLPVFVKPSVGGSSVGIRRVTAADALHDAIEHALGFDDRVVVERSVSGRELECAVLGYGKLEASVIGEIVPGRDFYDYSDKYLTDGARLLMPADLPDAVTARLQSAAVDAFHAIGGWGMGRVDFLLEGETPYINEINTLPGFTAISMYPALWEKSGLPLPGLVDRLVNIALDRHRDRQRLDQGIKAWIDELASRHGEG